MDDIAPQLYEELKSYFDDLIGADQTINEVTKLINDGKGKYKDADDYAVRTGQLLSDTFREKLRSGTLPDDKMYYNIAKRTVEPLFRDNHNNVADMCGKVQKALNEASGLNLRVIMPEIDENYIQGIIDHITDIDDLEKLLDYLSDIAVSYSQSVVDSSVRENARFQSESGLTARVYRHFRPGLTNQKTHHEKKYWKCPYCEERACPNGVPYEEVDGTGAWIWQRHPGCNCIIEYKPSRGFKQIVPPSRRREVQKNLERAAKSGKIKDRKDLSKYIGQKIFNGDNQHVREWYVANVSNIPNLLDKALTLEGQTRQAYALRNGFKHKARIAMADKKTAEYLDKKYPAPLFDELLERKMKRKHLTREQALLDILHTASVTNEEVNREFGL